MSTETTKTTETTESGDGKSRLEELAEGGTDRTITRTEEMTERDAGGQESKESSTREETVKTSEHRS
jgi:hypothetical protein